MRHLWPLVSYKASHVFNSVGDHNQNNFLALFNSPHLFTWIVDAVCLNSFKVAMIMTDSCELLHLLPLKGINLDARLTGAHSTGMWQVLPLKCGNLRRDKEHFFQLKLFHRGRTIL